MKTRLIAFAWVVLLCLPVVAGASSSAEITRWAKAQLNTELRGENPDLLHLRTDYPNEVNIVSGYEMGPEIISVGSKKRNDKATFHKVTIFFKVIERIGFDSATYKTLSQATSATDEVELIVKRDEKGSLSWDSNLNSPYVKRGSERRFLPR